MSRQNNIDKHLSSLNTIPVGKMGDFERDEFSKRPCDCCGDHLAGERYAVKALCFRFGKDPRRQSYIKRPTYWVCVDCIVEWQ